MGLEPSTSKGLQSTFPEKNKKCQSTLPHFPSTVINHFGSRVLHWWTSHLSLYNPDLQTATETDVKVRLDDPPKFLLEKTRTPKKPQKVWIWMSRVYYNPENHGISKLVVWRSQTPAIHIQTPL